MLALKHIHKSFANKIVARNINLKVDNGELLAILGPSGCGKSTLLNIISGLVAADSGEVWIDGHEQTCVPPEKRQVSLMFQDYALLPHLNVQQNVAFGLTVRRVPPEQARAQALAALTEVGLHHEAKRLPSTLSGGEQQRVALARALVVQPKVLLLDEAFSSLDTHLRQSLRQQTRAHIRAQNIPAVLVTHDPTEAFEVADKIALIHNGHIVQCDTPITLLQHPKNTWAAQLIGAHNVNHARYIPQNALQFNQAHGTLCHLKQCLPLPEYCRLLLQHPQHGELVLNLAWQQAAGLDLQDNSQWRVAVDNNKVVWFEQEGLSW